MNNPLKEINNIFNGNNKVDKDLTNSNYRNDLDVPCNVPPVVNLTNNLNDDDSMKHKLMYKKKNIKYDLIIDDSNSMPMQIEKCNMSNNALLDSNDKNSTIVGKANAIEDVRIFLIFCFSRTQNRFFLYYIKS